MTYNAWIHAPPPYLRIRYLVLYHYAIAAGQQVYDTWPILTLNFHAK